jgi:UDP-N-acetylmuramate--alanine ligase
MDADHLDIYSDISNMHEAFKAFASQVSGTVITRLGLPISADDTQAKILRYSYDNSDADFYADSIRTDECGYFTFNLNWPGGVIKDCKVGIPGWINVENAVAASAIALTYGLAPEKVRDALASFRGVKRRFDIHLNTAECSYIDDYAHHPKEISAAVSSIRDIFPGRRLTAIFQPHLYTRTRDFADEFAEALSKVDKLILLDIYPAREEPIQGVTSEIIFKNVTAPEKVMMKKEELMDYLQNEPVDTLITFGAGNIDRYIGPITEMLCQRQQGI